MGEACLSRVAGWLPAAVLAVALLLGCAGASPAEPGTFPAADVRPGMRATAWTVFSGDSARAFPVELIGVIPGMQPKGDRILFRGLGDSLARDGIAQGMSGSPVYVDGRILGAIAFGFPFAKEPIGMITPISEMLEGLGRTVEPPAPWMGAPTAGHALWRDAFLSGEPDPELWTALGPAPVERGNNPPLLALSASGWAPEIAPDLDAFSRRLGLAAPVAVPSGSPVAPGGQSEATAGLPEAGDAVGVKLVDGDASLAAIGTLTYREGDRVVAFGHPFFQAGPVELPLTTAWIHTIVPSYNASFKLGSAGPVVGTVRQDLRSGVSAVLGEIPAMLPIRIVLDGPDGQATYRYQIARGLLLEPSLLAWAATNSFLQNGWRTGEATLDGRLTVHYNSGKALSRRDRVATKMPAGDIAEKLLTPVPMLLTNPYEPVRLDSVSLAVSYGTRLLETRLTGLRAERDVVRPGERLTIHVRLRDRQEAERPLVIELPIPERWSGRSLLILAGGVNDLTEWDRDRAPALYQPKDLAGLERLIREFPDEGDLLVRVYAEEAGVVLGDRELGSLPPSVAGVLGSDHRDGATAEAPNFLLEELRINAGAAVSGGLSVRVRVE